MYKFTLLAAVAMILPITTQTTLAAESNCITIQAKIKKRIATAETNNSDNDVLGYQQVLAALKTQCDIIGLTEKITKEIDKLQVDIAKTQVGITQTEAQLVQALNKNDETKISQLEELIGNQQQLLIEQQDALEIAQAGQQALIAQN